MLIHHAPAHLPIASDGAFKSVTLNGTTLVFTYGNGTEEELDLSGERPQTPIFATPTSCCVATRNCLGWRLLRIAVHADSHPFLSIRLCWRPKSTRG
jgi:hypothetical protein